MSPSDFYNSLLICYYTTFVMIMSATITTFHTTLAASAGHFLQQATKGIHTLLAFTKRFLKCDLSTFALRMHLENLE